MSLDGRVSSATDQSIRVRVAGFGRVLDTVTTVAGLAAGTPVVGSRRFVTDSSVTTFRAVAVGGGAAVVPVYYDGTAWRVG